MTPPDMLESLEEVRKKWETGELIMHKESLSSGCHISLFQNNDGNMFTVFRYFPAGADWNVSCDGEFVSERAAWKEAMTNFA